MHAGDLVTMETIFLATRAKRRVHSARRQRTSRPALSGSSVNECQTPKTSLYTSAAIVWPDTQVTNYLKTNTLRRGWTVWSWAAMAIAEAKCTRAFGVSPRVSGCLGYKDERTLIYACGANCVLYDLQNGSQEFLPASSDGQGITALTVSSKRRYIAICEQGPGNQARASVWEMSTMSKKSQISTSECKSFVSAAFSADPKYLITLGGAPDYVLQYWAWDKGKVHAQIKATNAQGSPLYQVGLEVVRVW